MRTKTVPNINSRRAEIIAKGFITRKDLEVFIPCSYTKATKAYNDICHKLILEGKHVSEFGLPPDIVLKYFSLSEEKIRKYASEGY